MSSYPTPELFRSFPELRERLPWVPLARATPVERLSRLESYLHAGPAWIKRDDRTSDVFGGDAPRKLEFVFGDVLRSGARRIVTFGGVGSAHCLAVTAFAHHFELRPLLALSRRRGARDPRRTLEIEHDLGAELHRLDGGPLALWRLVRSVVAAPRDGDDARLPYFVWPRRAAALGVLGVVNGVLELKRQINVGLLPEPERIYVPARAGGTAAGLWLGCWLAGLGSTVVAVAGAGRQPQPRRLGLRALRTLRRRTHRVRPGEPGRDRLEVRMEYGPRSDIGSAAAHHAGGLSRDLEHLDLDAGSGARAMAALVDDVRSGRTGGAVLFWHTHPSHNFMPRVSADALPREFREFFLAR